MKLGRSRTVVSSSNNVAREQVAVWQTHNNENQWEDDETIVTEKVMTWGHDYN